jgi:hypothetical protein
MANRYTSGSSADEATSLDSCEALLGIISLKLPGGVTASSNTVDKMVQFYWQ